MDINRLRSINSHLEIHDVADRSFEKYGKVHHEFDPVLAIEYLTKNIEIGEGVTYTASIEEARSLSIIEQIRNHIFGEIPIQIGVCYGHNAKMNGMEYHKSIEVNIMATDCVFFLGQASEIRYEGVQITYDTTMAEVFFAPKGSVVEIYASTLHFAPLHTGPEGFIAAVILPEGTNAPLVCPNKVMTPEDQILNRQNKWIIKFSETGGASQVNIQGKNYDFFT